MSSKDHAKKAIRCNSCCDKTVHAKLEQQRHVLCAAEDAAEPCSAVFSKTIDMSQTDNDDRQSAQKGAHVTSQFPLDNKFAMDSRILAERERSYKMHRQF